MSTKLKERQSKLAVEIDAMQTEASEKRFDITFDSVKSIKTLQEHLNKGYTWKTQNAAVVVSLYDQFKTQSKMITGDADAVISLRGHELNALYQALLNVEGNGIENARRFITMLTQVGESVGVAMQELSTLNATLNELHAELSEIDATLDANAKEMAAADAKVKDTADVETVSPQLDSK
jgi:uncharacterized coiled-coil DUF342 family protein